MNQDHIRNFAIIAHIDHGKSTLADRLLEMTGTVAYRDMKAQLLDSNPIERERGITIKLAPVRMMYHAGEIPNPKFQIPNKSKIQNSKSLEFGAWNLDFLDSKHEYVLNLIDTPGHVDFSYEVSRSLAACEGAILVVDATQGVQAQTLAHLRQAKEHNLTIIPVINKIDMPAARIDVTRRELIGLGFQDEEMIEISARTGQNVEVVLEAIVNRIPSPRGGVEKPLRALVFSSQFDSHKGVVVFVRVVDGIIPFKGQTFNGVYSNQLRFMATGVEMVPIEVGYFSPKMTPSGGLTAGEVGYIATGLKDIRAAKVGDTITASDSGNQYIKIDRLPGYKEPKPMVFLGLFPVSADEFTDAREAMEKLRLSDSAFTFRPISSVALGNGFHCGFLGLLHAEVVQERILREFGLTMIATAPSVEYNVMLKSGVNLSKVGHHLKYESGSMNYDKNEKQMIIIQSASEFPDPTYVDHVMEPVMNVAIFSPERYVGPIMQLAQEKRGTYIDMVYLAGEQLDDAHKLVQFTYLMPLSEMIIDFFDRLKSVTEGYASLDYEFFDHQAVDVAKVDILLNHEKVDALSFLVVRDQAHFRSRQIVEKLATVIPRQQFTIPAQAAIGGTVIARADIKPFRKDVIQKLYGGDRSRKDKLLDKQKKGKERMKKVGRVEIPQAVFFQVLKRD